MSDEPDQAARAAYRAQLRGQEPVPPETAASLRSRQASMPKDESPDPGDARAEMAATLDPLTGAAPGLLIVLLEWSVGRLRRRTDRGGSR